jgi:phospholipase C
LLRSNLDRVEHVVVLMLENRSFDHMLGYLRLEQGLDVDGLTGSETNPRGDGSLAGVRRLASTRFPTDVGHTSRDVREQLEGPNQGFVRSYTRQTGHADPPDLVMGYHDGAQVWAYDYLARCFTVCDRWFASVPGPTLPNRLFSLTGSSDGEVDNPRRVKIYRGLPSIFECLDRALAGRPRGDRWGYYFHDLPMLVLLEQHLEELRAGVLRRTRARLAGWRPRICRIDAFFERARAGRLPALSWIDPDYTDAGRSNSDHPPKSDICDGQRLVASVYNAILDGGTDLWSKTLLVVLYDEHGGFFDHVPPPASGDPSPFDRLGVRVPALVVSAWMPPGVDSVVRDHTSLLRTILDRFAPAESLTPRVARAPSLAGLLSLAAPRRDARAIDVPLAGPAAAAERSGPATDLEIIVREYREDLARCGIHFDRYGGY